MFIMHSFESLTVMNSANILTFVKKGVVETACTAHLIYKHYQIFNAFCKDNSKYLYCWILVSTNTAKYCHIDNSIRNSRTSDILQDSNVSIDH